MENYLVQIPFFRKLSAAERRQVASVCEIRRFRKGEVLFQEGRPADSVWAMCRGWAYLTKRTPQSRSITVFTVTPQEVLCGFSAIVGQRAYYASAVAATDTTALRIPHDTFTRLMAKKPGFSEQVLAIYHARMRRMAETICLGQAPVAQRLAYALLRLKASFGETVPITHQELSRMAGTRWETSIRAIAEMKRHGWLRSTRGKITIVSAARLQGLLNGNSPATIKRMGAH